MADYFSFKIIDPFRSTIKIKRIVSSIKLSKS